MDIRQLESFLAVVRHGSIVRAAEALQYAQSTITLHIQQLEADLGLPVFHREGKRLRLTEAGEAVEEHGGQMLRQLEALRHTVEEMKAQGGARVRLGAIEPTAGLRLPAVVGKFLRERPGVRLSVEVGGTESLCQRVRSGELDFAVASAPPSEMGLNFEPLFAEPLAALLPANHPLAQHAVVAPADLARESLVVKETGCAYRAAVDRGFIEAGIRVTPALELGSTTGLQTAVREGLGVAILPLALVQAAPEGTVVRPFPDPGMRLTVGLVSRPADGLPSRAVREFQRLLRIHLAPSRDERAV